MIPRLPTAIVFAFALAATIAGQRAMLPCSGPALGRAVPPGASARARTIERGLPIHADVK